MKNQIEQGIVVKFAENNGMLNGGTVVSILDDSRIAINTLDGRNIVKNAADVEICRYQRRGKASKSFLTKLQKELDKKNKPIISQQPTTTVIEIEKKIEELPAEPQNVIAVPLSGDVAIIPTVDDKDRIIDLQAKTINALKNTIILLQKGDAMWLEEILNLITNDLLPHGNKC